MTDKQIIIDGVDVSGCEWFFKNDPCKNTCKYFCTPCEWVQIQNCMYKYAKRKEQECEELKNSEKCAWKSLEGTLCPEAQEQLDQLNEDRIEALKQLEFVRTLNTVKEAETRKLHKTLTEIKEIAETCINKDICTFCDYSEKCHIEDEEIPTYDVCKLILQKISEVEDGK